MGKQDGPLMGTGRAASMHNVAAVLKQHSAPSAPPLNTHGHIETGFYRGAKLLIPTPVFICEIFSVRGARFSC